MKEIPLTQGKTALVDDEDYEALRVFNWQAKNKEVDIWYAYRGGRNGEAATGFYMHREILGITSKEHWVDHRNRNGLDNRRANLRIATKSQNQFNSAKPCTNKSGYKGVYFKAQTGRWAAQIRANGRCFHLGYYDSAEEAARVYDNAAKEKHGEFARTNFG